MDTGGCQDIADSMTAPSPADTQRDIERPELPRGPAARVVAHGSDDTRAFRTYTHVNDIEDMRAAVAKLDFGPLEERAPAPVVRLRKEATFATNLLQAAISAKDEAPDRPGKSRRSAAQMVGAIGFEPATIWNSSVRGRGVRGPAKN